MGSFAGSSHFVTHRSHVVLFSLHKTIKAGEKLLTWHHTRFTTLLSKVAPLSFLESQIVFCIDLLGLRYLIKTLNESYHLTKVSFTTLYPYENFALVNMPSPISKTWSHLKSLTAYKSL